MVTLTAYTSYDEVRAVLGVSNDELEDTTLALSVYASALTMELEDIDLGIIPLFTTVEELAEDARSEAQQRFYDATKMFSVYAVAKQLTSSLSLFAPKDIGDGKATISRFADSPFRDTIKEVSNQYGRYKTRLATNFASLQTYEGTTAVLNLFNIAALPSDPVTGS